MMSFLRSMHRWGHGLALSVMALMLLFPGVVFAQAQGGIPDPLSVTTQPTTLPQYTGVQQSVADYLCTPNAAAEGTDLIRCINRLYRFGLAFGGVSLVGMIVLAGYVYFFEGEKGKSQAKGIVSSSLIGIVILATSFILLNQINPALTNFRPIQTPIFSGSTLPLCSAVGLSQDCLLDSGQVHTGPGTGTGGSCTITSSGNCSVTNMQKCGAWNPQEASKICMLESAGGRLDIPSGTDKCQLPDGKIISWSWGLFQFNLSTGSALPEFSECKNVINTGECLERGTTPAGVGYCKLKKCTYAQGQAKFDTCVAAITKSSNSLDRQIKQACRLYQGRSAAKNWCDWESSAVACKVKPAGFCR